MDRASSLREQNHLGDKLIGSLGGLVVVINNITGPAIATLPWLFQQSGWLVPTCVLILCFLASSWSGTMLSEAIARMPKNLRFDQRVEFSTAVKYYFGRKWYLAFQLLYFLSLQTMCMIYIIICSQVMDNFVACVFGKSYAITYFPRFKLVESSTTSALPFGQSFGVLSLGYVVTAVLFLPPSFMNLSAGIRFQIISFFLFCVTQFQFLGYFVSLPLDTSAAPLFGKNQTSVLGTILFAFCYSYTIPAWLSEKRHGTRLTVNSTIWISNLFCVAIFLTMGLLGSMAFPNLQTSNMLAQLSAGADTPLITRISTYVFTASNIGVGLSLMTLNCKYNLLTEHIFDSIKVTYVASLFPCWIVSLFFYQGSLFNDLMNWSSIFFNGIAFFVVPVALYLKSLSKEFVLRFEQECAGYAPPITGNRAHLSPVPLSPPEIESSSIYPIRNIQSINSSDQVPSHHHHSSASVQSYGSSFSFSSGSPPPLSPSSSSSSSFSHVSSHGIQKSANNLTPHSVALSLTPISSPPSFVGGLGIEFSSPSSAHSDSLPPSVPSITSSPIITAPSLSGAIFTPDVSPYIASTSALSREAAEIIIGRPQQQKSDSGLRKFFKFKLARRPKENDEEHGGGENAPLLVLDDETLAGLDGIDSCRAIPKWMPVSAKFLAKCILTFLFTSSVFSVGLDLYYLLVRGQDLVDG